MKITDSKIIPDVKIISLPVYRDNRGFFTETFRPEVEEALGVKFLQDNQSVSRKYVLRGIHFQWDQPMGKLSVDKAITFNPKFFGDVMSAYKPIAIQVRNKTYTQPPALDIPKINDDEIIEALYQNWDKSAKKDWKLLNIMAFDILWKRKDLNTTNLSKDVAEKIKAKVIAYYKVNAKTDKDLERLTDESVVSPVTVFCHG